MDIISPRTITCTKKSNQFTFIYKICIRWQVEIVKKNLRRRRKLVEKVAYYYWTKLVMCMNLWDIPIMRLIWYEQYSRTLKYFEGFNPQNSMVHGLFSVSILFDTLSPSPTSQKKFILFKCIYVYLHSYLLNFIFYVQISSYQL